MEVQFSIIAVWKIKKHIWYELWWSRQEQAWLVSTLVVSVKCKWLPLVITLWLLLIPCAALGAGTPWPPSVDQIFSVTHFILAPLFKEHTSPIDRWPRLWFRERRWSCVCSYLCETDTALGDALSFFFSSPSSFSCSLYLFCLLICFHLPVYQPYPLSAPVCYAPFILFIILFFSQVHLLITFHIDLASLSFEPCFLF